jgi:hypothetical protein
MLPRNIKKGLYHLPERLALRCGRRFSVDGVNLVVPFQDRDRAELLRGKVATALHLIKHHTPKYFARVQKFVPNILVLGAHAYTAVYISDLDLCDIARDFALSRSTSAEQLAMTLVHEATHGFLASRGISYSEDQRAQIERICVRAEIALASRLPQADGLATAARRSLDYGPGFWTDKSFLQREVENLTKIGMPRFLVRRYERKQSRRQKNGSGKKTHGTAPS